MKSKRSNYVNETQGSGLANKVVRGTFWISASAILSHIIYFLRTIILVRLLNPIDFGLMGIAAVVIEVLKRFSETGVGIALVQRKEVGESTLNTAWIMTAIRGIILFVLLYAFSPAISNFYNNEHLSTILRFISMAFIFNGLASVGIFLFIKELNFKNRVIYEQANAISSTVVSIILAVIFKNVWALVIGYIAGNLIASIFSYILHPFRPSLKFDLSAAKGLLNFGKYVFGSGIVLFFIVQGPHALIGKILGLDLLGFFVVAFSIANTPATSITHLVSQIAFPAYVKLQDDLPKLREAYLKVTRLVAFLSIPLVGGIFMLIPEFIQIFLGIRWMPIVLPVRILCVFGLFRAIGATVGPVFYGTGRPDLEFKISCLNLTVLAILVYPLTVKMGIAGTSIALSLVSTVSIFCTTVILYKLIRLDAERIQFLKILFFPLAGMVLMCFLIFLSKIIFSYSLIVAFLVSILIGIGVYILVIYVLDKYFGYGLVETIRFAVHSFKGKRIWV
jgi:O-antigen/teichoic acid export membrane protein